MGIPDLDGIPQRLLRALQPDQKVGCCHMHIADVEIVELGAEEIGIYPAQRTCQASALAGVLLASVVMPMITPRR